MLHNMSHFVGLHGPQSHNSRPGLETYSIWSNDNVPEPRMPILIGNSSSFSVWSATERFVDHAVY